MHTQRTPPAFGQHLKISARLRRLDHSESVFLSRYQHVHCIVASDLQEHSGIRPALVSLSRGMQKTWSQPDPGCPMFLVTHSMPDRMQDPLILNIHVDIS